MPMVKSRKTTPKSARCAICSEEVKVTQDSHGYGPVSRPSPKGPSNAPAPRNPRTGLIFSRWKSGTTIPAVARKRIGS